MANPIFSLSLGEHQWRTIKEGEDTFLQNLLFFVFQSPEDDLFTIESRITTVSLENIKEKDIFEKNYKQFTLFDVYKYFKTVFKQLNVTNLDIFKFNNNLDFEQFILWAREREKRLNLELENEKKL